MVAFVCALLLILLVVVGPECLPGRPTNVNFAWIRPGMAPTTAKWIMGAPSRTWGEDDLIYEWQVENDFYTAYFHRGTLTKKAFHRHHVV
jgi:hypothetical protein